MTYFSDCYRKNREHIVERQWNNSSNSNAVSRCVSVFPFFVKARLLLGRVAANRSELRPQSTCRAPAGHGTVFCCISCSHERKILKNSTFKYVNMFEKIERFGVHSNEFCISSIPHILDALDIRDMRRFLQWCCRRGTIGLHVKATVLCQSRDFQCRAAVEEAPPPACHTTWRCHIGP